MTLEKNPYAGKTPYEILGVSQVADLKDIKEAYRKLYRTYDWKDPRAQEAQEAKEILTKMSKRIRCDLLIIREKEEYKKYIEKHSNIYLSWDTEDTSPSFVRKFTDLDKLYPEKDIGPIPRRSVTIESLKEFYTPDLKALEFEFDR